MAKTEHRFLSLEQAEAQKVNSRRIAPGIWVDAEGNTHFSVPELLAMVDLEDTPENREAVIKIVADSLQANGLTPVGIVRQDIRPD